jgi:hypothetical protein
LFSANAETSIFNEERKGDGRLSQNDGMKPAAIYDIENVERRQAHAF